VGWTVLVALAALWQQGQTGHAAGATNHHLAVTAMVLHLVSAAVWVGGLAALALLVRRLGADLVASVERFSVLAGWCVAGVVVSGAVNAAIRLDGWAGLGTAWGRLLVAKVALVVVLALLGLVHRRRTIPRLAGAPRLFWRLVAVELAVLGAVSGIAVALGSTAPPDPGTIPVQPSPAYLVTGEQLPPEPTALRWLISVYPDVLMASAAAAGVVVYLRWVLRLRRRGDSWPWLRTASWLVGMLGFAWATVGGVAAYGHVLFSAHMVQHMVLATVVPIFLALAAPVTLALRALPSRGAVQTGDLSRGPREWILVLVHSRWGQLLANPLVAAANFALSMIVFYYTDVFAWALRDPVGHVVMVVHFSLVGYLFANALVGVDPGPKRPPYPLRLVLLFATMGFHAFFGVSLQSGTALLVADWFGLMGRPWGPSALVDQQLGGSLAWGIGELPTLALAIGVAVAWSRDDERAARRRDRRVDSSGSDRELDEYNRMLTDLAAGDQPR
jgi:putative copper resistance protein D